MAKSSFTRRQFLKVSAWGASALAMNSCSTLDRRFMGDRNDLEHEVVILGAGAAGLSAAFELKKRRIPFRIFEGSSRVGGRVQTVSLFPEGGPVAELGAEFFDSTHGQVLRLAKELNLPVSEIQSVSRGEPHFFLFERRLYRALEIEKKLKTLQRPLARIRSDLFHNEDVSLNYKNALKFERAQYFDSLSLRDLLDSWQSEVDPIVLQLIQEQAVNRFGLEANEQSAMLFLETLGVEGSSLLSGRTQLRMQGGLSQLMQALADRVSGVIPGQIVKMNHSLLEISERKGVFSLTFASPQGRVLFVTRNVICTLPFSTLREVRGVGALQFSSLKREAIFQQVYGTHSKGVLPFSTPFWRLKRGAVVANLGNFTGEFSSQKFWDSGRGQKGEQGILTFQRGGRRGREAGEGAVQQALRDLELFYGQAPAARLDLAQIVNWSQKPWIRGSLASFKPGQFTKYKGVAGESEYSGHFLFAGEHASLRYAGTLQGALETGMQAASEVNL